MKIVGNDPATRLRLGAAVLAKFWRRGDRCVSKWDASCLDPAEDKTDFCKAKMKWVHLASQYRRSFSIGSEYAVVGAMWLSEFEASSLTMTISHPTHGRMGVGPRGSPSLRDLQILSNAQAEVPATMKVLEIFPDSVIVGTTEPEDGK